METAASVVGFVALGIQVCQSLLTYYSSWKDCRSDVAAICTSLQETERILVLLRDSVGRLEAGSSSSNPRAMITSSLNTALQTCENTMRKLDKKVTKIQRSTGDEGFFVRTRASWEKLKYPLRESTILKLRDLLHQGKLDVILVLNILRIDTSFATVTKLNSLDQNMKQISVDISGVNTSLTECKLTLQTSGQNKEQQAVLDWLCNKEISLRHYEINAMRYPGTCNWIFDKDEFRQWKTKGSILWVNGGIGCGKSVLCSAAIEHLRQYCGSTGNLLLYFYFSFKDQDRRVGYSCLAGLLKQLCAEQKVMSQVKELYSRAKDATTFVPLRFDEVEKCLASAITSIKDLKQVYIVLDALDELTNEPDDLQRTKMLKWITEVAAREPHVHILLTSRTDSGSGDIKHIMEAHPGVFRITINGVSNRDDMRSYLTGQFQDINALRNLPHASQVNLLEMLLNKANGMFQWLQCQLADLAKFPHLRPKDIRIILDSMPKTLESTYSQILLKIPDGLSAEAAKALQWISLSSRPLTLEEANEACIINPKNIPILDEQDKFTGDGIVSSLPGLLNRTIGQRNALVLSHLSVKEFLTSPMIQSSPCAFYGFQNGRAQSFIAESCIAYMNYWLANLPKNKTYKEQELELFPLLRYACQYWSDHFKFADAEDQVRLTPAVIKLLRSREYQNEILPIYNPISRSKDPPNAYTALFHPLGWSAALGLTPVAETLLRQSKDHINSDQDVVLSLPAMSYRREYNTDPDFPFWRNIPGTALMKAVQFNHPEVALLLIEHGADIHMKGPEGHTALSIACEGGRESLVRLLLENGADPNQKIRNSSPLMFAISSGRLSVCEMLLDGGALVQGLAPGNNTPLMKAAKRNELDIVKLLLDRGADVNQQVDGRASTGNLVRDPIHDYPDVLSLVAMDGEVDMVKFLLSRGARISPSALVCSLTGLEDGPLESHRLICEIFIRHGADLNPDMPEYDSPLAMALHNMWYDIAQLMMDKGALVQPHDPTCRTAGNILVAAIHNIEVTTHILDLGIDVNAPGALLQAWAWEGWDDFRHFATALQAAAYHHKIETVQLLLLRGADITIKGPPFGNALFAALAGTMSQLELQPHPWSKERQEALDTRIKQAAKLICAMLVYSKPNTRPLSVPWGFIDYDCFCTAMEGARELGLFEGDIISISESQFHAMVCEDQRMSRERNLSN